MTKNTIAALVGSVCTLFLCEAHSFGQALSGTSLNVSGTATISSLVSGTASINLLSSGTANLDALAVTGTADILGNCLYFGSWSADSSHPGISLAYTDETNGVNASITQCATRPSLVWNWQRLTASGSATTIMQIDGSNRLILTGTDAPPRQLVLDPNGTIKCNGQDVLTMDVANQQYFRKDATSFLLNGNIDMGGGKITNVSQVIASRQLLAGDTTLTTFGNPNGIPLVITAPWGNDALSPWNPAATGSDDEYRTVAWFKTNDSMSPFDLKVGLYPDFKMVLFQTSFHGLTNEGTLGLQPSGGMVGIRTMYPNYTLDVAVDINFTGNLYQNGSLINSSNSAGGGNVGIGTSYPQAALDIQVSNSGMQNLLFIGDYEGGSGDVAKLTYTGNDGINALVLNLLNNSGTFHRPFAILNGNVGIGTPTPQTLLDVNGNTKIAGNLAISSTGSLTLPDGTLLSSTNTLKNVLTSGTGPESILTQQGGDSRYIVNGGTAATTLSSTTISGTAAINGGLAVTGSATMNGSSILTQAAADSHYISANAGLSISNGNVGIGTTNPGAQLQINSSSASTVGEIILGSQYQYADLTQWQDSFGGVLAKVDSTGAGVFGAGSQYPATISDNSHGSNITWKNPYASNAARLNQRSNGEILYSANVNDYDQLDDTSVPAFKFGMNMNWGYMNFQYCPAGSPQWDGFEIAVFGIDLHTGNASFAANLAVAGNVGIGTGTPQATLDVQGSARFSGAIRVEPQGDLEMGAFTTEPSTETQQSLAAQQTSLRASSLSGATSNASGTAKVITTGTASTR